MTGEESQTHDRPAGWFILAARREPDGTTGLAPHRSLDDGAALELTEAVKFIHAFTSFREFRRAIEIAHRWVQTIDRASANLRDGLPLPRSIDAAIRLDTEALAKATTECDQEIREGAGGQSDTPDQAAKRMVFEARRRAVVATPEYLRILGLASAAHDGTLGLVFANGTACIAGREALEPDGGHENLPVGGHRNSPLMAIGSPHGWPSDLPTTTVLS
jgi:hypothetical protein